MKIFKNISLFILFAGVTYLSGIIKTDIPKLQIDGNSEIAKIKNVRTGYNIEVKYIEQSNRLFVKEKIGWRNTDAASIDTFFFNIPKKISGSDEVSHQLAYKISEVTADSSQTKFNYVKTNIPNSIDSTLGRIVIPEGIEYGKNIRFTINYTILLPPKVSLSRYDLYNFENWYVSLLPVIDGKQYKYPIHKYIEQFSEYSDFSVSLELPDNFDVAVSGSKTEKIEKGKKQIFCKAHGIPRFNWFLFTKMGKISRTIHPAGGGNIKIILFIRKNKSKYSDRYFDAAEKYLSALSNFGEYPYGHLTIIDLPNSSKAKNKSYPGIVALKSDLISPVRTQKIEYNLAELIAEQYFGNIIAADNYSAAWLSKGISSYLAEFLVRKYYGDLYSHFILADYYPVYGLNFMTFAGIPLIYTITDTKIPAGARFVNEYYKNIIYSDLSIPACQFPDYKSFRIAAVVKPQLVFLTMHNYMGEKFDANLKKYFNRYKFSYPTASDFLAMVIPPKPRNEKYFYEELFTGGKSFDYGIKYITKRGRNDYSVMVERLRDGIAPVVVKVTTSGNDIILHWDGKERFKLFNFSCDDEIILAELDPLNKNILDVNFSNNSYVVKKQYWGALSLATRVFFWFQNALMLIGGAG